MACIRVAVQTSDFDCQQELDALLAESSAIGAVVHFIGTVRNDAEPPLVALELEHYPGMTERSITTIVDAAVERWPLLAVTVIHRVGRLQPGERIVLVAVASRHRQDAFAAAEYLMDFLKSRAPFWKKETDSQGCSRWVDARVEDAESLAKW